jgi:hypothetical protein
MAYTLATNRKWSPPSDALSQLRQPLTEGERRVLKVLDQALDPAWEFYVQPYLNGVRPDLVVLNPKVGIAVFEVKDWNLSAMEYLPAAGRADGLVRVRGADGRSFCKRSPLAQVLAYRHEIRELYCPSLGGPAGLAVVTAGVIFTEATTNDARQLLERELDELAPRALRYLPVSGEDHLAARDLSVVFPESSRPSSRIMSEAVAVDLRTWLEEPEHARESRMPISLDSRQLDLVNSRTRSGMRRLRGPAGSGKTLVLASRAARLAQDGREVLVVTYNHTLRNYIRDLVARQGVSPNSITWLGFHEWCRRTMTLAGQGSDYRLRFANGDTSEALGPGMGTATIRAIKTGPTRDAVPRYDAILVDEGQDFHLEWWNALGRVRKDDGEMLLIADRAQDIYGRAGAWTEQAMLGAGFRGPWNEFDASYRLPAALTDLIAKFREEFQPAVAEPRVRSPHQLDLDLVDLTWRQVDPGRIISVLAERAAALASSDLCVLCDSREVGMDVVDLLSERGIKCQHTFASDSREERKLKRYFFRGDARVKITTIHSFKGWEAPRLLVGLTTKDPAVAYTAMTRMLRTDGHGILEVVSSADDFAGFGSRWPGWVDARRATAETAA